jgi:DNA gyrase/topoisomerase IV subunit B
LIKIDGFLLQFITPLVKIKNTKKSKLKKDDLITTFYSLPEYESWKNNMTAKNDNDGGGDAFKGQQVKYYKGVYVYMLMCLYICIYVYICACNVSIYARKVYNMTAKNDDDDDDGGGDAFKGQQVKYYKGLNKHMFMYVYNCIYAYVYI